MKIEGAYIYGDFVRLSLRIDIEEFAKLNRKIDLTDANLFFKEQLKLQSDKAKFASEIIAQIDEQLKKN